MKFGRIVFWINGLSRVEWNYPQPNPNLSLTVNWNFQKCCGKILKYNFWILDENLSTYLKYVEFSRINIEKLSLRLILIQTTRFRSPNSYLLPLNDTSNAQVQSILRSNWVKGNIFDSPWLKYAGNGTSNSIWAISRACISKVYLYKYFV